MAKQTKIPPDVRKAEGSKIRFLIKQKKEIDKSFTQTKVASLIDREQTIFPQWLSGKTPIPDEAFIRLSQILGFDPFETRPYLLKMQSNLNDTIEYSADKSGKRHSVTEPSASYGAIDHSQASFPQLVAWENLSAWCNDPNYNSRETIYCHFPSGPGAMVTVIAGEAMSPDYREGEYICIDPGINASHGDDVLVLTSDDEILFRRYQTVEGKQLLALNEQWPDRRIKMPADARICGVVIGSWMHRRVTDEELATGLLKE